MIDPYRPRLHRSQLNPSNSDYSQTDWQDAALRTQANGEALPLVWFCDALGQVQFANDEWRNYTGQTLADVRGWGWSDAVHPDESAAVLTACKEAFETDQAYETQLRYRRSSGDYQAFLLRVAPCRDESNSVAGWVAVSTNLEQHRRLRESLEAQTRSILQTAVEGIITIDARGIVQSFNPSAEHIFGFSADEVIGHNVSMLMPEPDRSQHDTYLANYLTTGDRKIIGIGREVVGRKKDGTTFPMELAVSEFELDGQRRFTGMVRDITERKQADEALRQQHQFNESVIETAQAIMLILDPDGRIVRINSFTERISGYKRDEVQGKDWFATFLPQRDWPRVRALFHRAAAGGEVRGNINPILTKHGVEREIAWWGKALTDDAGRVTGVLCVGHDLTELKQARQKAMQAERLAGIGQMMTGLAHESRNALQRAQACLDMLELDLTHPELLDLTARARKALDELNRLYEEVRGYAAPVTLETRQCALSEIWEQAWKHVQEVRPEPNIQFHSEVRTSRLKCQVDPQRLEQVFRNVFENAIAACMGEGTAEITVNCADTDIEGRAAARIAIRDSGPGLNEDQQKNILEPFFTTKTKGTGLGMAIAKRIVEAHGGLIEAHNATTGGAEVVVTLPREAQ